MDARTSYEHEYPGWTEDWLRMRLTDLYYLIIAYLEAKNMLQLLSVFQAKYSEIIKDHKLLLKTELMDPEGEPELKVLFGFKQFLEVFQSFDYMYDKEEESKKLLTILKNTGYIITNSKASIENEADIYKEVKWVLNLYYPTCRLRNKASFIQEFKTYNPDILIPELRTAIEYKYLKHITDNVDDFIDQIKIDATNYIDDHRYDKFVAVIFIKNSSIATPESIEVAWKSKKFPANWELVVSTNSGIID